MQKNIQLSSQIVAVILLLDAIFPRLQESLYKWSSDT